MDQPQNVPENAHFVGHVAHTHNSPIDIEGEEGDDEDGDGVRTVSRLIWKQEEDERVVSMQPSFDSLVHVLSTILNGRFFVDECLAETLN